MTTIRTKITRKLPEEDARESDKNKPSAGPLALAKLPPAFSRGEEGERE